MNIYGSKKLLFEEEDELAFKKYLSKY